MSNKKGFTLIELLIVIVIIGILSVAVVPSVLNYPKKARDGQRKQTIGAMIDAMNAYIASTEGASFANAKGCLSSATELASYVGGSLPKDPSGSQSIYGKTCADGYYYITDNSNNKITAFAFVSKMELNTDGNTASANSEPATVSAVADPGTTGDYFAKKTTAL